MLKVISFTIKKYKFSFLFYVCTIFIYKAAVLSENDQSECFISLITKLSGY